MDIKSLRKKLSLSQDELAAEINIPRDRIAKWEQGKGNPKQPDYDVLKEYFKKHKVWENVPLETKLQLKEDDVGYDQPDLEKELLKKRVKDLEKIISLLEKEIAQEKNGSPSLKTKSAG